MRDWLREVSMSEPARRQLDQLLDGYEDELAELRGRVEVLEAELRITEDGAPRITEDGAARLTEG